MDRYERPDAQGQPRHHAAGRCSQYGYPSLAQRRRVELQRDLGVRGIAGGCKGAVGGHRRRQRAILAGRRKDLGGVEQAHRRRHGRQLRRSHCGLRRVAWYRVRHVRPTPFGRLRALHLSHHRLWPHVESDDERTRDRRTGAQYHRIPRKAERAVRRHRALAVRHDRQRRRLDADRSEPSHDALRRLDRPCADEGSRDGHARTQYLDSGRRVTVRRVDAGGGCGIGTPVPRSSGHDHQLLGGRVHRGARHLRCREPSRGRGVQLPPGQRAAGSEVHGDECLRPRRARADGSEYQGCAAPRELGSALDTLSSRRLWRWRWSRHGPSCVAGAGAQHRRAWILRVARQVYGHDGRGRREDLTDIRGARGPDHDGDRSGSQGARVVPA